MLTSQHQLSLSLFLIKHDRGALCRVYLNKVTNHRLAPVVVPPHACFPCTELCFSSGTAPQPHPGPVSKVPRRLPHVRLQLGALPCRDLTELQPSMKRMHLFTHTYFRYNTCMILVEKMVVVFYLPLPWYFSTNLPLTYLHLCRMKP